MDQSSVNALRPGDVVRLRIWREPDLSGDYTVDEAGMVTFPKIGPYDATKESPNTLREQLLRAYAAYLRNPSVEIIILRRINILGAVQKPGLYPVDATMTVSDAVALAGGPTPMGDQHRIEIIHGGVKISQRIAGDTRIAETPLSSGDQLFVPERSFVVRNSGLVATIISVTASLAIALFIRR